MSGDKMPPSGRIGGWWLPFQWLFFALTVTTVAAGVGLHVGLFGITDHGVNVLALCSFAVTSFAVYLAIRIFRNQASQSEAERAAQDVLLGKIEDSSARAAESAYSANANAEEILRHLDLAQRLKTGQPLSSERGKKSLLAYGAIDAGSPNQVLWVDDNEHWIALERAALEAAGISTVWVPNTTRALDLLIGNSFKAVITDMARKEGPREGFVLLDSMRRRGNDTPVIVYTGSVRPEHLSEVLKHGGQGAVDDPGDLFEVVMSLLAR